MHPSIFSDNQWLIMMFWYAALTSICGGIFLLVIVKSGYKYMHSALNPGIRVSFIEDAQRSAIAMGLIALTPVFITILFGINDGFVWVCGTLLNHFVSNPEMEKTIMQEAAGMFETVIAAPFKTILTLFNTLFGLKSLDDLIFNGVTQVFGKKLLATIETGNVWADVFLNSSMVAFDVYFNAVYAIRMWVITASVVSTPIIAWVWVFTAERQVLEIWVAEIIQTTFMQSCHALSLGIFMSIAGGMAKVTGSANVDWYSSQLVQIGVFFAGFAGSVCAAVIVVMGIRLILARNEKERTSYREGLIKALIGLVILGLCVVIASFFAFLLSGSWGVK